MGATLNVCFRDERRFPLRRGRGSRWYPEFQWLSRNNYLRVDKDTVELTAAGIDLRNLALGNASWQNFIRLYASLARQPALPYEEFIRESKAEFYRYSPRGLGWLPRSEPFACEAGKMVLAVLPAFYFRESHWVEVHMLYGESVPLTMPFRSPVILCTWQNQTAGFVTSLCLPSKPRTNNGWR